MGLFDNPFGENTAKSNAKTMRSALTPAMKYKIKEALGNKCEMPNCTSKCYEVHHIKPVSCNGGNSKGNLIGLCANCHRDAHDGVIPQSKLKAVVRRRSANQKKQLDVILRNRRKVGNEKSSSDDNIFLGPVGTKSKRKNKKEVDFIKW